MSRYLLTHRSAVVELSTLEGMSAGLGERGTFPRAEDLLSIFLKEPRDARRAAGLIRWKCAAILASNVGDATTPPR